MKIHGFSRNDNGSLAEIGADQIDVEQDEDEDDEGADPSQLINEGRENHY